jgi:hypothetical protein
VTHQVRRTRTWDQGSEMRVHHQSTLATEYPGLLLRPALTLATRQQKTLGWDDPTHRLTTRLTGNNQQRCNDR